MIQELLEGTSINSMICTNFIHCRSSTARSFSNSWFGIGNGTSQDLRPQCAGVETKIAFCPLGKTWNEQACSHAHDAGIQCTTTSMGK